VKGKRREGRKRDGREGEGKGGRAEKGKGREGRAGKGRSQPPHQQILDPPLGSRLFPGQRPRTDVCTITLR
jgi:hypothetical protein